MNLRFIMRDGKKILQERKRLLDNSGYADEWQDVPLVAETQECFWIDSNSTFKFEAGDYFRVLCSDRHTAMLCVEKVEKP